MDRRKKSEGGHTLNCHTLQCIVKHFRVFYSRYIYIQRLTVGPFVIASFTFLTIEMGPFAAQQAFKRISHKETATIPS